MKTRRVTDVNQDLWRRMRNTGVPLRDTFLVEPPGLRIEQFGGINESQVFTLPGGVGIGYIIWLRVIPNRSGLQIECWEPKLDPPDLHFQWLQAARERYGHYIFPGGPEYPPEEVLNHHVQCSLVRPLRGALLAFGGRPISEHYPHGSSMELEVSAIDQHDQRYPTQVKLWVSRAAERDSKSSMKQARRSLFERPPAPSPAVQPPPLLERDSEPGRRNVSATPQDMPEGAWGKPNQTTVRPARLLE
ncbi:MAG: hypothetical protein M3O85_03105 [Acidobacteriota bacterium]|nr:hypothetical protein [Acidobacteriota bacterium]